MVGMRKADVKRKYEVVTGRKGKALGKRPESGMKMGHLEESYLREL